MAQTRSILITGGNRGIGLATAKRLVAAGHSVCITARRDDDGRRAVSELKDLGGECEYELLDLASFARVAEAGERLSSRRFDVVLHNAGVLIPPDARRLTEDGIELTLQVNAVAPVLLSRLLLPALNRPARLVWTGSGLHRPGSHGASEVDFRFDDPHLAEGYTSNRAYKNSKLAQIWISSELDRRWQGDGIRSDVVCPGFVPTSAAANTTGIQRFGLRFILPLMPFATSLETAAKRMEAGCLTPLEHPGGRFVQGTPVAASQDARSPEKAARFFEQAMQWIDGK